jgi:hypothetical protein
MQHLYRRVRRTRVPRIEPRTAPTTTPVGTSELGAGGRVAWVLEGGDVGLVAGAVEGERPILVVIVVEARIKVRTMSFCRSFR